MFKAKVYIYKNINGTEVKVEKKFDDEDKYNEYIKNNPDLKKMENDFKEISMPKSFIEMGKFFEDFDKGFFGDLEKNKGFFDEINQDFKKIFEKSKKLLEK